MCNCNRNAPVIRQSLRSGTLFMVVSRNGTETGKYYTDETIAKGYAERIAGSVKQIDPATLS